MRNQITLIVSHGQYETAAVKVNVTYTTVRGLLRRARQLSEQYAVYGDNWAGWIPAQVAIASDNDKWRDNNIIGGQNCSPKNGWLVLDYTQEYECEAVRKLPCGNTVDCYFDYTDLI